METKKYLALILAVLIFTCGIVLSAFKVSDSLMAIKGTQNITVTGSAKTQIKSDLIIWQATFNREAPTNEAGYQLLSEDKAKVLAYLKAKGIADSDISMSAVMSYPVYELNYNGISTNKVLAYRLSQTLTIESTEVDAITKLSREASELMKDGVDFQSMNPQYYYTKIADLKVSMIGLATKDAKMRAEQISENTGSTIGQLKSAKMGVFQITPLYSTEVSDMGINDTSSMEKEITAVVTCSFEVK